MKKLLVILLTVAVLVSLLTLGVSAAVITDQEPNEEYDAQNIALGDTMVGSLSNDGTENSDRYDYYRLVLTERTKVTITMKTDNALCAPELHLCDQYFYTP